MPKHATRIGLPILPGLILFQHGRDKIGVQSEHRRGPPSTAHLASQECGVPLSNGGKKCVVHSAQLVLVTDERGKPSAVGDDRHREQWERRFFPWRQPDGEE